jgi:UDP-N-acetylglucosamine transferase subunit ALG13
VIFVTLGTQAYPFDRLLRALGEVDEELVVQGGASTFRPKDATWLGFVPVPQLVEHVRRARVVVSHAGVGSVLTVVGEGKRPVVVPRLKRYGEAVDDHQAPFARRAAEAGLVTLVEDLATLPAAVAATPPEPVIVRGPGTLVDDLRSYLRALAGYSR